MKFEDNWSKVRLRQKVKNWLWDTMLAAHIIDNRTGVTSLKFLVYVLFGIIDYESEVSPYLQAKEEGANSLNQIEKLIQTKEGVKALLYYNGLDAIYEYRVAKLQMELFYNNTLPF